MTELTYLKTRASECFKGLNTVLSTLNRDYPKSGYHWGIDEDMGVARRFKVPTLEWEPFEEPNDPVYTEEEQELVLRR